MLNVKAIVNVDLAAYLSHTLTEVHIIAVATY
jgi:hypothetical protein